MAYRRSRNTHVVLTGKAYIKQQDFLKKSPAWYLETNKLIQVDAQYFWVLPWIAS